MRPVTPDGGPTGGHWMEMGAVAVIGMLATVVRLAADPPKSLARTVWLLVAGLGLATGGWLLAKAAGLDGWGAMAAAWVFGAVGSEAVLPLAKRWAERFAPPGKP